MRLTGFHRVISALLLLCMLLSFALIPNTIPLRVSAIGEYTGSNPPPEDITHAPSYEYIPESMREEEEPAAESSSSEESNILFRADLPVFYQNDYPNVRFGSGTVANNGCSVTALAMVASYLTGHPYTPDALADYFGGEAENNIARLQIGSQALQLPYRKAKDWHDAYRALEKGKIVIVLVAAPSSFTSSQHFIVLNGLTKDGKVFVTDPNRNNYDKWDLKQGLETGFDTYEIWSCWEGGWIYDKAGVADNVPFYEEPRIDHSNPRYPDLAESLNASDIDLIARVVWAEARGESMKGQQAVAEVVLNRLHSEYFPDRLYDVVYGEGQFRTAWMLDEATPYQVQYEAIERAIYGPYVLPETVVYFGWEKANQNVWGWIGRHVFCHEYSMVMPEESGEDEAEEETSVAEPEDELPEVDIPEVEIPEDSDPTEPVFEQTLPEEPQDDPHTGSSDE